MATAAAAAALHLPSLGGMSPAPGRALQTTSAGTFSCSSSIASTVSGSGKFGGAATTPSGIVVFVPNMADCVGLWDPATQTFSCPSIASTVSGGHKFLHAATTPSGSRRVIVIISGLSIGNVWPLILSAHPA